MSWRLLGSASDLDQLAKLIGDYWYSATPYDLRQNEDGVTWGVFYPHTSKKAGQQLIKYRVLLKKSRYRFEVMCD
jgi:hypothetical protein